MVQISNFMGTNEEAARPSMEIIKIDGQIDDDEGELPDIVFHRSKPLPLGL